MILLETQAAELRKNRQFCQRRLDAVKATLGGKQEGSFEDAVHSLGTSPESAERLAKIVRLIDEALAKQDGLSRSHAGGAWNERDVVEFFTLKAQIDRKTGREFERFVEAMQAWANVPEERPVAFAEEEPELPKEEIKEEPIKEKR